MDLFYDKIRATIQQSFGLTFDIFVASAGEL